MGFRVRIGQLMGIQDSGVCGSGVQGLGCRRLRVRVLRNQVQCFWGKVTSTNSFSPRGICRCLL